MIPVRLGRMEEQDAAEVAFVVAEAFSAAIEKETGTRKTIMPRSPRQLAYLREGDPAGCLVARQGQLLAGCVFSRTWGAVGWIGPLAVRPELQGMGIGARLLGAAVNYLRGCGVRLLGLEARGGEPGNVGFYMRHGFTPAGLRLIVAGRAQAGGELPRVLGSEEEAAAVESDLRRMSAAVCPGLDYAKEVRLTCRYGLGWLLLDEAGFALLHEVEGTGGLHLRAMVAGSGTEGERTCERLLLAAESWTARLGKTELAVPVYAGYRGACGLLLTRGYRVKSVGVRMFYGEPPVEDGAAAMFHLDQWAG